jgi:hypothetical protein
MPFFQSGKSSSTFEDVMMSPNLCCLDAYFLIEPAADRHHHGTAGAPLASRGWKWIWARAAAAIRRTGGRRPS